MKKSKSKRSARPSWDDYFMDIANKVAARSTCDRAAVGAVIVKNKSILSTGYNGSPRGMKHCDEIGHELVDGHCVRTCHSEENAIAQAARSGVSIEGATIYTTFSPCYDCFKILINGGITEIVYSKFYHGRYEMSENVVKLAKSAKLKLRAFPSGTPSK